MMVMLLLVSFGGPCHFLLAIISLLWVQCITGRQKGESKGKVASKHYLVTPALLKCMLQQQTMLYF